MAIAFFVAFLAYQFYRYLTSHALWLLGLAAFDLALIGLAWMEYCQLKRAAVP